MRFKVETFEKLHARFHALGDREIVPVTLPRLVFMAGRDDPKEVAEQILSMRTVRAGRDAWQAITRAESFEAWAAIGKALAIGRDHALKLTGANAPHGRRYSLAFSAWAKQYGFDGMEKSVRSVALELHSNIEAITEWRATLPERQRKQLVHALSNVRRWRASTVNGNRKCLQDLKREAMRAWRRFVSCARLLPPDQAAPLWQCVVTETRRNANDNR
jgi:hypothetical protein